MSFLERLLGDDETRFPGDGGTADRAADMEDKRFSFTLCRSGNTGNQEWAHL